MNGFLLDTNVLSEFSRKGTPNLNVKSWLRSTPTESLYASILTLSEIRLGIELLPKGRRRAELEDWLRYELPHSLEPRQVLPVTQAISDRRAVCSAQEQLKGRRVEVIDGLIAATAFEHDLTVVTRNVKDFEGLGIEILNPWQ